MKHDFNPYDELGVAKDATPSDIKSAYRRKAKETHPDSGGSDDAFERVNRAKLVLLDDARRARFDKTGLDEEQPPSLDKQALDIIAGLVQETLQEDLEFGMDLVKGMRGVIGERKHGVHDRIAQMQKVLKRAKKLQGRFRKKSKGAENPIERMIGFHIERIEAAIEAQKPALALFERVLELLEDYDFEIDMPPPQPVWEGGRNPQHLFMPLGGGRFTIRG